MPVPTEVLVKCAVCGITKQSTNRWLLWAVDGREFHFDLYDPEMLPHYDGAACGAQCLLKKVQEHVLALMALHPAGKIVPI